MYRLQFVLNCTARLPVSLSKLSPIDLCEYANASSNPLSGSRSSSGTGEPIRLSRADTQRGALCTSHRLTGSKFSALHDLGDIYVPRFHYQLQPIIPSHVLELPFGTWSFCSTCTILHLTQFSKHTITYTSRQPFV